MSTSQISENSSKIALSCVLSAQGGISKIWQFVQYRSAPVAKTSTHNKTLLNSYSKAANLELTNHEISQQNHTTAKPQ